MWTLGADGLVGVDPVSGATTPPWRPIEVLGHRPEQIASGGDHLLLATPGAVTEIDPVNHRKLREVPTPPGTRPLSAASRLTATEPQTIWAFHRYEQGVPDLPRGTVPRPVTVGRLDFDAGAVVSGIDAPFPESHGWATDGDVVWLGPLRERRVVHFDLP